MHRSATALLATTLMFATACGGGTPTAPGGPDVASTGDAPSPTIQSDAAGRAHATIPFDLRIDPGTMTATIVPLRSAQAQPPQALRYDLDIAKFLTPATLEAAGVALTSFEDVTVRIRHKHPFPAPDFAAAITAKNRADLGYTGRLFVLAETVQQDLGSGITVDPMLVRDADGYASPGDLLRAPIGNTHYPYILLADEAKNNRLGASNGGMDTGNYDPATGGWQRANAGTGNGKWTGFDYVHQGQTILNEITFDRTALETANWNVRLALVIQYTDPRGVGGKDARMPFGPVNTAQFAYRLPFAALDVSRLDCCGHKLLLPHNGALASLNAAARDWDANAVESTDADLSDETAVDKIQPDASGVPAFELVLPDLFATPVALNNTGGSGAPRDEYELDTEVENVSGAAPGTYWGFIRAVDPEAAATDRDDYHFGVDWDTLAPDPARALAPITIQPVKVEVPPATASWFQTWGELWGEDTPSMEVDAAGNIYVLDGVYGTGEDLEPGDCRYEPPFAGGNADVQLSKFNADGQRVWTAHTGGPGAEYPYSLVLDSSGNPVYFMILDNTAVDLDPGPGVQMAESPDELRAVVKLNPDGDLLWADVWGPITGFGFQTTFLGMAPAPNGGLYLAGPFHGDFDVDPGPGEQLVTSTGGETQGTDGLLLSLDSTGTLAWHSVWGGTGSGDDELWDVAALPNGGVAVAGRMQHPSSTGGDFDLDPGPAVDLHRGHIFGVPVLATVTADGAYVWGRSWLGRYTTPVPLDGFGTVFETVVDSDGNLTMHGIVSNTGDFDPGPGVLMLGADDTLPFFTSFDAAGVHRWAFDYEEVEFAYTMVEGIHLDNVGRPWFGAVFFDDADFDPGPGVITASSAPQGSPFMVRFDTDGGYDHSQVWQEDGAQFSDAELLTDGRFMLGGGYRGTFDPDPGPNARTVTSRGGYDPFIMSLSEDMNWD